MCIPGTFWLKLPVCELLYPNTGEREHRCSLPLSLFKHPSLIHFAMAGIGFTDSDSGEDNDNVATTSTGNVDSANKGASDPGGPAPMEVDVSDITSEVTNSTMDGVSILHDVEFQPRDPHSLPGDVLPDEGLGVPGPSAAEVAVENAFPGSAKRPLLGIRYQGFSRVSSSQWMKKRSLKHCSL